MSASWSSYPKIYNVGHAAIRDLFAEDVVVEEKVDGSQFSFGRFDGELKCRSKGKEQHEAPDKMFQRAVEIVGAMDLMDGWTYSGELLNKPKHNTLTYDRTPKLGIVLFDIRVGEETYLSYAGKESEAARLGLEVVPILFEGRVLAIDTLMDLLERESFLGGPKIEGFVVKNYVRFTRDGKAVMGKFVSEAFKEKHGKDFRKRNPSQGDVVRYLCERYRTEARWDKAIQHLRDDGKLEGSPRDIGALIKEIQDDLFKEEADDMKEILFKRSFPQVSRATVAGFPEYYKRKLAESAFDDPA